MSLDSGHQHLSPADVDLPAFPQGLDGFVRKSSRTVTLSVEIRASCQARSYAYHSAERYPIRSAQVLCPMEKIGSLASVRCGSGVTLQSRQSRKVLQRTLLNNAKAGSGSQWYIRVPRPGMASSSDMTNRHKKEALTISSRSSNISSTKCRFHKPRFHNFEGN